MFTFWPALGCAVRVKDWEPVPLELRLTAVPSTVAEAKLTWALLNWLTDKVIVALV